MGLTWLNGTVTLTIWTIWTMQGSNQTSKWSRLCIFLLVGKTLSTRFLPTFRITTTPRLNVPLLVFQIIAQLKYSQSKGLKHRKQYKLLFQGTYDQVIVLQCKRIYMKSMLLRWSELRKVSMLQRIIKTGLDSILPMKPKIVHRTEPPWINSTLKTLIRKRQVALGRGDRAEFNHLRNLVNRERKRCRAKYYECKV